MLQARTFKDWLLPMVPTGSRKHSEITNRKCSLNVGSRRRLHHPPERPCGGNSAATMETVPEEETVATLVSTGEGNGEPEEEEAVRANPHHWGLCSELP